jgi:tripartite-type tricarboxylate transporter receptor subunit TctC
MAPAQQALFNAALNTALKDPVVWRKLEAAGISNEGGSQRQLSAFIAAETQRVAQVVTRVAAGGAG